MSFEITIDVFDAIDLVFNNLYNTIVAEIVKWYITKSSAVIIYHLEKYIL